MIPITTIDQLIELASRSTYLLSGLRAWQRDFEETRAVVHLHKDEEVAKWEIRVDEFLKNIDAVEFSSLKELIEHLSKIKTENPCTITT
jgi:PDZ domain-containing secreted protein